MQYLFFCDQILFTMFQYNKYYKNYKANELKALFLALKSRTKIHFLLL